jgi:sulfur-oxidizing protein SoxZ
MLGDPVMARALINVPAKAKRGEIIEIKALIQHEMETGFRVASSGNTIPRNIITDFICKYSGEEIFRAELFPAIAANPFFSFFTTATESGTISFEWSGDNGFSATAAADIAVE